MCNEKVKFGNLWGKAKAIGAEFIATGHYAIVEHHADRAVLRKGRDPRKDQSYFLFSLRQAQLQRALCPARRDGEDGDPRDRAQARAQDGGQGGQPGDLFRAGQRLQGVSASRISAQASFIPAAFTTRRATGSASTRGSRCSPSASAKVCRAAAANARYVIDIDPATSSVIVGDAEDLITEEFEIDNTLWHDGTGVNEPFEATVKIRYAHPGAAATIYPAGDGHCARPAAHAAARGHARPGRGLLSRR